MALKFPDILEHNNSNLPLVDVTEMRGNTYPIGTLSQTGSIPESKRKIGAIVFVSSSQEFYGYYGQTSASGDWNTASNWRSLAATATSASFATTAATASYVPASAVVGLNLNSITSGSVTASVDIASTAFSIVSSSNTLLDVSKDGAVTINSTNDVDGLTINGSALGAIRLKTPSTLGWSIYTDAANTFNIYDFNDGRTRFYMNDAGGFGLNTTNVTGYSLSVSGSARFYNNVEVSGSLTVSSGLNVLFKVKNNGGVEQGNNTSASGDFSHAEGNTTQALGSYSHAEGESTIASGYASHTEGNGTTASGKASHAEGNGTQALGDYSHAEGSGTAAVGSYSHAEGESTIASGYASHTEGNGTQALGDYSHAEGEGTIASGSAQTVMGKYNTQGNNTSLVIIGNGVDDGTRSDLVLFNSANVVFNTPVSASVFSGSFVGNGAGLTDIPAGAISGLNLSQIGNGAVTASTNLGANPFTIVSGSTTLFNITQEGLATVKNLTVSDNLVVNGTASFINTENLLVKDPFVLINSGSSALTDSGIVSQYNSSGEGSAFYIEGTDTGTYGRWAVAYGVQQGFVSVTADEYVVTAKKASGAPPATPTWGGANNGFGNIYVNSDNGEIYIYA